MGATGAILNLSTGLQALARLDQALPNVTQRVNILAALEQQRLDHAARARLATDQAGRHHARLVDDEHIARLDIVDDVTEDAVLDGTAVLQRRSRLGALRSTTSRRQESRGSAGAWAISSSGRL